jgi:hypothetical protein
MRIRGTLSVLAIIGMLALAGPAAALDVQDWNQERVSELATQFQVSADKLYQSARVERYEPMQRFNKVFLIVEDLNLLRRYASRLARQLQNGENREATEVLVERITFLVREIRVKRTGAQILENSQDEIATARAQLEEIVRYYGKTLPPIASPPAKK